MSRLISLSTFLATFLSCHMLFGTSHAQTVTGQLGNAVEVTDNPMGAAYVAEMTNGPIKGSILAISAGKRGTDFAVNFDGLPTEGGPFIYHIHVAPVPPDGNCTSTLAHLDPYIRGEDTPCQANRPETCQVGDLAGKHGKIEGTKINASYSDPFVSLKEGEGSFFGNRSIVIHFANKTRIACANFESVQQALTDGPVPAMPPIPSGTPGVPGQPSGGPPLPSSASSGLPPLPSTLPPAVSPTTGTFTGLPPLPSTINASNAAATSQAANQGTPINNSANELAQMSYGMVLISLMAAAISMGWI